MNTKRLMTTCILLSVILLKIQAENDFALSPTDRYKYYDGNRVGRVINLNASGPVTKCACLCGKEWKETPLTKKGETNYELLLPYPIGVEKNDTIPVRLFQGKRVVREDTVAVRKMRYWNLYMFPHSHVDIGYTQTQQVVEFIHRQNIEQAIELAEKTRDYPEDARYCWNTEVAWPMERYLACASPEQREKALRAIREGSISVDNSYLNTNSTAAHEPELLELYSAANRINALTGKNTHTMIQVDIPGFTWGLPAIASLTGVKNIISLPNGGDRTGRASQMDCKPRYWLGPDGKSKILFIQPGCYILPNCDAKRRDFFFKNLGLKDTTLLPKFIKTDDPRALFIDGYIGELLPRLEADPDYVYDACVLPWCVSDNVPIDADLPDAVKSWNEEYAYPHLKISNSEEIVAAFEKYKDKIPTISGDYSEYWTDGLGTSAMHTGHHREVKERLAQAEILSCLTGTPLPQDEVSEAWRNALLGTEHTWAYIYPDQPISDEILGVKFGYFHKTDSLSQDLMNRVLSAITAGDSRTFAVFNTESFQRNGLVKISQEERNECNAVKDALSGERVATQVLSDGSLAFIAHDVPAFGCRNYILEKGKQKKNKAEAPLPVDTIDNGKVRICIDSRTGDLVSMVADGREFINQKTNVNANSFRYLKGGQATIYATTSYDVSVEWEEYGPVVKTLRVHSKADGCNALVRRITLLQDDEAVYIDNVVDKIAVTEKEGVHFGFSFQMGDSLRFTADVPFGIMELEKDQWPQANRNWMGMQRWVNLSDKEANVTLCSLNAPIFEVGDMTANIIGSWGNWIEHIDKVPTIWSWALNNHWHTNFRLSQDGMIGFKYILRPALGEMDVVASNQFAQSASRPLVHCMVEKGYEFASPFTLEADPSVVVSAVRPVEDGKAMMVMLHSLSEKDQSVRLGLRDGYAACLCDAWGTKQGKEGNTFLVNAHGVTFVRIAK